MTTETMEYKARHEAWYMTVGRNLRDIERRLEHTTTPEERARFEKMRDELIEVEKWLQDFVTRVIKCKDKKDYGAILQNIAGLVTKSDICTCEEDELDNQWYHENHPVVNITVWMILRSLYLWAHMCREVVAEVNDMTRRQTIDGREFGRHLEIAYAEALMREYLLERLPQNSWTRRNLWVSSI